MSLSLDFKSASALINNYVNLRSYSGQNFPNYDQTISTMASATGDTYYCELFTLAAKLLVLSLPF